jgi:membrane associated rhomboid family serine protease
MGIYDRDYYQADEMRPMRPWDGKTMVTLLIVASAAVYLANFLFTQRTSQLAIFLALSPSDLANPIKWFRLVSYGFVHSPSDPFHLIFNMATLYFLGRNVEDKYGKWEFFRFYMIALILGGLGWSLLHFGSPGPLMGASGATTAVAMLFVFSFPTATLMLYGVLPVKAWVMGIAIVVMNVLGSRSMQGGIAYDVHLIGAALAGAYFFGNLRFNFLGDWFHQGNRLLKQKRRGLKVHRPQDDGNPSNSGRDIAASPSRDELEADRLLEKIHREGKDSLTAREQSFLENYSRKVREQRK